MTLSKNWIRKTKNIYKLWTWNDSRKFQKTFSHTSKFQIFQSKNKKWKYHLNNAMKTIPVKEAIPFFFNRYVLDMEIHVFVPYFVLDLSFVQNWN